MAQLQQAFNAATVRPQTVGGGQLPVGEHVVVITDSEIKAAKNQQSGFIQFTVEVQQGSEHAGTTAPYRLNVYNQNETATRIAWEQFSALCHVTGVMQVQDTAQLHNIPFIVVVGLQRETEENRGKGYTEIKGVKDVNGNNPGQQGSSPTNANTSGGGGNWATQQASEPQQSDNQQPPQQPTGGGAAPWQQGGGGAQQPATPQQPWQQNANPGAANPPWGQVN